MRRFGLSLLAAMVAFGISLMAANEKPTPVMVEIMKSNAAAGADLRAHQKEANLAAVANDAATLKQNFAYIEAFFANKKMQGAVTIAQNGAKAAADLQTAALAKDSATVEKSVAAVTGTCGGCHKQFREQLPDKSYEIKVP
jgi:hypothetical protein